MLGRGQERLLNLCLDVYKRQAMHNMTVKSKLLRENKVKLLEHCFYTDTEFFIKSVANSKNVYVDDKAIYCYRVGREGQSVSLRCV